MANDLEDDWALLGRPGKIERSLKKTRTWTMGFLEFTFTWIGHAYDKIGKTTETWWGRIWHPDFLFTIFLIGLVLSIGYGVTRWASADGRVAYCRIVQTTVPAPATKDRPEILGEFSLVGHRYWRPNDERMFVSPNKEDVLAWAKTVGCPLR